MLCRAEWFSAKILQNAAKEQSPTAAQEEGEGSPGGHAPKPQAPQQSSVCVEGDERKGKVVGVSLLLAGKQLFFFGWAAAADGRGGGGASGAKESHTPVLISATDPVFALDLALPRRDLSFPS